MEPSETGMYICGNWNYRWRMYYHWWVVSFFDKKWNRTVSTFQEIDQRKLRGVTKKVNAVAYWNRSYNSNKQTCYGSIALGCKKVVVKKGKRGDKKEP